MENNTTIKELRPANKINPNQKRIMIDFMLQHPNLARNIIQGTQGKRIVNRLWMILTKRLNQAGPPIKGEKMWRKVYADQKHMVKKKISINRECEQEIVQLCNDERLIMEAAGLPDDSDNESQASIGSSVLHEQQTEFLDTQSQDLFDMVEIKPAFEELPQSTEYNSENSMADQAQEQEQMNANGKASSSKRDRFHRIVNNVSKNLQTLCDEQKAISLKLDKILLLKERSMRMAAESHEMDLTLKRMDIERKAIELQALKAKSALGILTLL